MRSRYADENGNIYIFDVWTLNDKQRERYDSIRRYSLIHSYMQDNKPKFDNWTWNEEDLPDILGNKYINDDVKEFMRKIIKLLAFV